MLDFGDLSISEKVGLAAFIVTLKQNTQAISAERLTDSSFTPTPVLAIQLLNQLLNKRYISAVNSNNEELNDISLDELNSNTTIKLNLPNQRSSFNHLLDLIRSEGEFEKFIEKEAVIASVLIDECRSFVYKTAVSEGLRVGGMSKDPECLRDLFTLRSLSEVYLLLWRALKDVCPIETNFYHLRDGFSITFERVSQKASAFHEEYARNGQRIKPFKRPAPSNRSSIMLVLRETILSSNTGLEASSQPLLTRTKSTELVHELSEEEKLYLNNDMPGWLEAYSI